jgi:hypothetical protein
VCWTGTDSKREIQRARVKTLVTRGDAPNLQLFSVS